METCNDRGRGSSWVVGWGHCLLWLTSTWGCLHGLLGVGIIVVWSQVPVRPGCYCYFVVEKGCEAILFLVGIFGWCAWTSRSVLWVFAFRLHSLVSLKHCS